MGRKFLGIKISTYLIMLLSLACAVIFWLYVNLNVPAQEAEAAIGMAISDFLL